EILAAATALVLAVGAIVVALDVDERTARVPFGEPAAWEGGAAAIVLTPGAESGERLRALANPPGGVPLLVVSASGRGRTGCLPPYDAASVLRPGAALRGGALARALGEREPRAPFTIALCVPGARAVTGLRAVDLTWGSRPLD
ncbi:MAG TPA: hypothetical protein VL422_12465, partial [Miltoncostaea sp.]|nr:hypothetical protein [Miltoncostaea sp.]